MFRVSLRVFDTATFAPLGSLQLPGIAGEVSSLVFVGPETLAFRTDEEQVFLISKDFVKDLQIAIDNRVELEWLTPEPIPVDSEPARASISERHVRRLDLATNDLIYDPVSGLIFASIPSRAGHYGNSITSIDPLTGRLGPFVFVGSEPGDMAVSDDGRYLYVFLKGAAAIRRVNIPDLSGDIQFTLGRTDRSPRHAVDIEVMLGRSGTVAISLTDPTVSPGGTGVTVYDDGVPRPQWSWGGDSIEFSSSAGRLYGAGYGNITQFYRLDMDENGVSSLDLSGIEVPNAHSTGDIEFDGGLIYTETGAVIDPECRSLVGTFVDNSGRFDRDIPVEPDSEQSVVFFLQRGVLKVFDKENFALLGSLIVPEISGDASSLILAGPQSLAFRTEDDQIFLISKREVIAQVEATSDKRSEPVLAAHTSLPVTPTPTPVGADLAAVIDERHVRLLDLATNDLAFDPVSGLIFASIPARACQNENSVAAIDPGTAEVDRFLYVGINTDPGNLAVSDDGRYLYVTPKRLLELIRVNIPALTTYIQFSLGDDGRRRHHAADVAVMPGNSGTVVVSLENPGLSPRFAAVVVYDDGVQRPLEINRQSGAIDTHVNVIEFSFSADILYGRSHASRVDYSNEKDLSSRTRFYRIAVNEDGVSVLNDTVDALPDGLDLVDMQFDDGLIYTEDGALIDPEGRSIGGLLLGTFEPRATWDTRLRWTPKFGQVAKRESRS